MMRLLSSVSLAAALVLGVAAAPNPAQADHGHRRYHHYEGGHHHHHHHGGYQYSHSYYPRPSYHYDYVPHGDHIDVYRHYDHGYGHGHHHHGYYQPRYYGGYRGGISIRW